MIRYVYVSHGRVCPSNTRTDFDALGSVAIMWRGALKRGLVRGEDFDISLIDYYSEGLESLLYYRDATITIADIPPETLVDGGDRSSADRFRTLLGKFSENGVRLNFVDHHPRSSDTDRLFRDCVKEGLIESAILSGMDHEADRTKPFSEKRCAAEMVRDFLEDRFRMEADETITKIARYAHDQDFGIRKIADASKVSTLIGADYNPLAIAESLAVGEFWSDEMEEVYKAQIKKTRRLLAGLSFEKRRWKLKSGRIVPVVYALLPADETLKVTVAGIHCIEKKGAEVAVIVSRNAFISLRIVPDVSEIHAGRMLSTLGGGGHHGAGSAGGRGGWFPYRDADEGNFEDVVTKIDLTLTMAAGAKSQ